MIFYKGKCVSFCQKRFGIRKGRLVGSVSSRFLDFWGKIRQNVSQQNRSVLLGRVNGL